MDRCMGSCWVAWILNKHSISNSCHMQEIHYPYTFHYCQLIWKYWNCPPPEWLTHGTSMREYKLLFSSLGILGKEKRYITIYRLENILLFQLSRIKLRFVSMWVEFNHISPHNTVFNLWTSGKVQFFPHFEICPEWCYWIYHMEVIYAVSTTEIVGSKHKQWTNSELQR